MPALRNQLAFVLAAFAALASACTPWGDGDTRKAPLLPSINQGVSWLREVHLQENGDVINVIPRVVAEPGRFLVTDSQEEQVRLYGPDGSLVRTFGRRGSGPGEFQHITRGVRLRDGRILVADMIGLLTVFDSTGAKVLHTARPPLGPIYEAEVLDDSLLLLVARRASGGDELLHLWNVNTDRLVRSFFTPPSPPRGMEGAYAFTGFADAAVRGDTIAALFGLADTVYLFRSNGDVAGKLPIPFHSYRQMDKPIPTGNPQEFQRWNESYSAASDVFWLRDGSFLVQYFDRRGGEPTWSLTRLDRKGTGLWEVSGSPRLLAVGGGDSLVFVKPDADAPNVWSIARLAAH